MGVGNVQEMEGAAYLGVVLDESFLAPAAAWIMAASQFGHRTYDDPGSISPYMRQLYDDTTGPSTSLALVALYYTYPGSVMKEPTRPRRCSRKG